MIVCFLTGNNLDTIEPYLESWVPGMAERLALIPYEDLWHLDRIPAGTLIFGDLERLGPDTTALAAAVRTRVSQQHPDSVILNDPVTTLRRFQLLDRLFQAGLNPFQVYRLTSTMTPDRFPVFLRYDSFHSGPLSDLLHDQDELDRAIVRALVRGRKLRDLLIVEFFDTSDENGRFVKYGAFVIGDRVLARHVRVQNNWVVKLDTLDGADVLDMGLEYIRTNPHQHMVARIAEMAGIGYGRLDYSVKDDRLVAWEFNTNPVVVPDRASQSRFRLTEQAEFVPIFTDALRSIDNPNDTSWVDLSDLTETLHANIRNRTGLNEWLRSFARPYKDRLAPILDFAEPGAIMLRGPILAWLRRRYRI